MSILDPILLAFIAGMAVRDLWPLWIRRTAAPKRLRNSRRLAKPAHRRASIRRMEVECDETQQARVARLFWTHPLVRRHLLGVVEAKCRR
jgi:hypothetical protein